MDQAEKDKRVIEIHLEEFKILRAEMVSLIKWRDGLAFAVLGLVGGLLGFGLKGISEPITRTNLAVLHAVPSLAFGGWCLWGLATLRMSRLGDYFREQTIPKVRRILADAGDPASLPFEYRVLEWEERTNPQRLRFDFKRKLLETFFLLLAFAGIGVGSQLVVSKFYAPHLWQLAESRGLLLIYYLNWLLIGGTLVGQFWYVFSARELRKGLAWVLSLGKRLFRRRTPSPRVGE